MAGETKISKEIRDALTDAGYWSIRINSGTVRVAGGFMHLAPKGTPDILVLNPYGWLEIKTDKGVTSEAQIKFRERCAREGIRHAEVRSAAEAVELVTGWRSPAYVPSPILQPWAIALDKCMRGEKFEAPSPDWPLAAVADAANANARSAAHTLEARERAYQFGVRCLVLLKKARTA